MPKEYAVITLVNYATLYVRVYLVPRCKAETVKRWSGADKGDSLGVHPVQSVFQLWWWWWPHSDDDEDANLIKHSAGKRSIPERTGLDTGQWWTDRGLESQP